jgi:AraC-like DNA-binding protein
MLQMETAGSFWHEPWFVLVLLATLLCVIVLGLIYGRRLGRQVRSLSAIMEHQTDVEHDSAGEQPASLVPSEVLLRGGASPEDKVFLEILLRCLTLHMGDSDFSVEWIADEIGLSRRALERKVHAITGHGPADLRRIVRLRHASYLLRTNGSSVSEVAREVGFRSVSHFSKVFKKSFGESPSAHAASGKAFIKS